MWLSESRTLHHDHHPLTLPCLLHAHHECGSKDIRRRLPPGPADERRSLDRAGEKILLRVKRRRDDEPLEAFVVESQAKRPSLRSAMSSLNVGGGAAGKSSRAASKLFKLLGSVPVAEEEAEERAQVDSSNSAADDTTTTATGGTPAAADEASQPVHHHHQQQHQHHGTGAGTGCNNAKKADENRLEGGASARRKEAISKVVSSAKAARNSAVNSNSNSNLNSRTSKSLNPTPYTVHPTPYTLHPTPYSLLPTPYSLLPTPYSLHLNPRGCAVRDGVAPHIVCDHQG